MESLSNKAEQLNLRISTDLKKKLSEISDKKGISMSDLIRQNLENVIINKDIIENRISSLETMFDKDHKKLIKRMLYAAANIASIDTGLPLDQCLSTTLRIVDEFGIQNLDITHMTRDEIEIEYLKIQEKIKEILHLSDQAIAFISVLILSFMGIIYNEHFFDMSPMSVITLERLRIVLQH